MPGKPSNLGIHKVKPTTGNGLAKESLVDCFQLKSVSRARFRKRVGTISVRDLEGVKLKVISALDLM
jgi:mRNA-degrading endonuclease toxin of MazEF toxin-antitoxin module